MGSWFPQPPLVSTLHPPEDAMMEDTTSRRGYAPTAAWDEGNMIQAMARMKNPTIAWRFGDG